jgi:hypothetical protein
VEKKLAKLREGGTVDFSELYFQQDFLSSDGAEGEHVDHVLGIRRSQFSSALGNILGGDVAGENDGGTGWRNGNLFVREDPMFFLGGGADIHVDAEIKAARAFVFVPDEQRDFAGSPPVNQDLRGSNDGSERYRRVGDGDALEPLRGVDEQRLADHYAQRSRALGRA